MAAVAAELTPTWVLLLSALYRMARPAGSTPEDAWQWLICEGEAGRILARGWIQDRQGVWQEVWLTPSAFENIDRATGTLRLSPSEVITNIELPVDDLRRRGRWPPLGTQGVGRGQLTLLEAVAWLVLQKLPKLRNGEWPIGLEASQVEPAIAELVRAQKQGFIEVQGLPDDEPAESFWLSPRRLTRITFSAAELMSVYPVLVPAAEWIGDAIDRYLSMDTADADLMR
jgi:hypothetical protein